MSHRQFDPVRDAVDIASRQWLLPGERLLYVSTRPDVLVEMPRRNRAGKLKSPLMLRILKWVFLWPFLLWHAVEISEPEPNGPPASTVTYGPDPRCLASAHLAPGVKPRRSFWVLTDRRFAYLQAVPTGEGLVASAGPLDVKAAIRNTRKKVAVTMGHRDLPVEPVRLTAVAEYGPGEFSPQGVVVRELPLGFTPRTARYHRILLRDGSGVDLIDTPPEPPRR
ncbi:hypothetical protein LX16_0174 [Stackebrandtia albiflava]|uniref:Uncharacterized protein n=1 Tax=Stackebrandtia albiflava TaxID=406432 RepID=A0A562V9D7_9ACTN|nr:hypothetical protein [Stackebrandtia albiflava]TWJ14490.1 hypothetical protein LX16_0174 [Stackebrandtia albiflava]